MCYGQPTMTLLKKDIGNILKFLKRIVDKIDAFFSIIMPTYNQANFIKAAIQSVLDQTFEDWELIIVNNYSSDETIKVISILEMIE